MASETELARIVFKITGDTADYQKKLRDAEQATDRAGAAVGAAGKKIEQGIKPGTAAVGNLGLNAEKAKRSAEVLGRLTGVDPAAVQNVTALGDGFRIASAGAATLVTSLGAVKAAFAATGIGLAILAVIELVKWMSSLGAATAKANETASAAFASIAGGSRTLSQALADVRLKELTEGIKELVSVANPGFWASVGQGISSAFSGLDPVSATLDEIIERAQAAAEMAGRLAADPRQQMLLRTIAVERNTGAVRDQADAMEREAERAGMSEQASRRLAAVQQLAEQASISRAAAERMLAADLDRLAAAEDQRNRRNADFRLTEQIRDLEVQAQAAGLSAREQDRLNAAWQVARERNVSLTTALRDHAGQLDRMAELQTDAASRGFLRGLQDQIEVFGMSAERAEVYRLRLRGASEAELEAADAAIAHLNALRALQNQLERIEGTRFGSAEHLARLDQARRQLQVIAQGGRDVRPAAAAGEGTTVTVQQAGAAGRANTDAILGRIETLLRNMSNRPGGALTPAGLGG